MTSLINILSWFSMDDGLFSIHYDVSVFLVVVRHLQYQDKSPHFSVKALIGHGGLVTARDGQ